MKPNGIIEGDNHYVNSVKFIPLIEKYPEIFLEELDFGNIFKNSKEIYIGVELPKDLNYTMNYKISGDILSIAYKNKKKTLIDKIIILSGRKDISKIIGITKNYKNLKIKFNDIEEIIDGSGNSNIISLESIDLKVERGKVFICINDLDKFVQGMEFTYTILSSDNEIIEKINLKFYIEN